MEIKEYANFLNEDGELISNLILIKPDASQVELFNDIADLNMAIFWASWCGRCRMEVPQLKTCLRTLILAKS